MQRREELESEVGVERGGVPKGLAPLMRELADPARPISTSKLVLFSDLSVRAVQVFSEGWLEMPDARRLETISKLIDLGEDNVELNFAPVFRRLLLDDSAEVRTKAISGLWECDERSLIEPLVRLLEEDGAESVRAAAAQALGRFVLMAETGKLLKRDGERISAILLATLESEEETIEVRRRAIEAIAPMSLPGVPDIIRTAYESDIAGFKSSAIYAMGLTCDTDWLPTILAETKSDDPEMRYEAAVALGEIGEEETAHILGQMVNDEDPLVQAAALNSLGNIGGPAAKRILNNALAHDDPRIAELAEQALASADFDDEPAHFPGYGGERRG